MKWIPVQKYEMYDPGWRKSLRKVIMTDTQNNEKNFFETAVFQVEALCNEYHYDNTLYQETLTSNILMPNAVKIVLQLLEDVNMSSIDDAEKLIEMTQTKHTIFQRAMLSVLCNTVFDEETGEVILPSYDEVMNGKNYIRLIERDSAVGLRVINFKGRAELLSVTSYNGQPVKLVMVPYFDFN